MADEKDILSYIAAGSIFQPGRLIADPAMLRLLSAEKIRDFTVIAMEAQLKAQQQIVDELKAMKF